MSDLELNYIKTELNDNTIKEILTKLAKEFIKSCLYKWIQTEFQTKNSKTKIQINYDIIEILKNCDISDRKNLFSNDKKKSDKTIEIINDSADNKECYYNLLYYLYHNKFTESDNDISDFKKYIELNYVFFDNYCDNLLQMIDFINLFNKNKQNNKLFYVKYTNKNNNDFIGSYLSLEKLSLEKDDIKILLFHYIESLYQEKYKDGDILFELNNYELFQSKKIGIYNPHDLNAFAYNYNDITKKVNDESYGNLIKLYIPDANILCYEITKLTHSKTTVIKKPQVIPELVPVITSNLKSNTSKLNPNAFVFVPANRESQVQSQVQLQPQSSELTKEDIENMEEIFKDSESENESEEMIETIHQNIIELEKKLRGTKSKEEKQKIEEEIMNLQIQLEELGGVQ